MRREDEDVVGPHVWVTGDPELARYEWKGSPLWAGFLFTFALGAAILFVIVQIGFAAEIDRIAASAGLPMGIEGRVVLIVVGALALAAWMTYHSWQSGRHMPPDLVGVRPWRFGIDLRYGPDHKDSEGDTIKCTVGAILFTPGVDRRITLPRYDGDRIVRARFSISQGQIRYEGDEPAESRGNDYQLDDGVTVVKSSDILVS
ncbi:hypothetical protein G1C96_0091 [Bifidobacterium sp. DSM 109958]|uniref:Uncharacterized protein n=1 Tax=Bifidobacterium moraviense TaxID=2675323 RepID=A0A7Y0HYU6_9BIFI|nr:hypothetical protein [Bifidobacterium sp. DSM 109958]NMM99514.1 hypothetical protein [Bifidobacterium sp. DSM 109958]